MLADALGVMSLACFEFIDARDIAGDTALKAAHARRLLRMVKEVFQRWKASHSAAEAVAPATAGDCTASVAPHSTLGLPLFFYVVAPVYDVPDNQRSSLQAGTPSLSFPPTMSPTCALPAALKYGTANPVPSVDSQTVAAHSSSEYAEMDAKDDDITGDAGVQFSKLSSGDDEDDEDESDADYVPGEDV